MLKKTRTFVKTHKKETALAVYGVSCMAFGVLVSKDHYKAQAAKDIQNIKRIAVVREMQAHQKGMIDGIELFKLTTKKK